MAIAFTFAVDYALSKISAQKKGLARVCLTAAVVMLSIFGLVEQFNAGNGQFSIAAENAQLGKLAAKLPTDCSSFYVVAGPAELGSSDSFQNQNYMHDAMLVSILTGVPTLNGRSGRNPPGWFLRDVNAPDYQLNVKNWIVQRKIDGKVCRLEIDN
jgi:hypothetical protein